MTESSQQSWICREWWHISYHTFRRCHFRMIEFLILLFGFLTMYQQFQILQEIEYNNAGMKMIPMKHPSILYKLPESNNFLVNNNKLKLGKILRQHHHQHPLPLPQPKSQHKFAYAFLLGGVLSNKPNTDYHGGLYSIIAIVHALRYYGSNQADFIIMIQMSTRQKGKDYNGNKLQTKLPKQEQQLLRAMNITIQYIPMFAKKEMERFYALVLEKFRILELTSYERVMFLDYDILPKCNLDYIMELSVEGMLQPNIVLGYKHEPSNTGLFVLKPNMTDYKLLRQIIFQKEQRTLKLFSSSSSDNYFDPIVGWGHTIQGNDSWIAPSGVTGTNWSWFCAYADQGLLYHWTKYVKHSVSLISGSNVENIVPSNTEKGFTSLGRISGLLEQYSCSNDRSSHKGQPAPYRDFVHFTGGEKPWNKNSAEMEIALLEQKQQVDWTDNLLVWYWHLKQALIEVGVQSEDDLADHLNFMGRNHEPPVGRASSLRQMYEYIIMKKINGWAQYRRALKQSP